MSTDMTDVRSNTPILKPLALPLRGPALIEASAGTGKTYTLAMLYLRLVLNHGGDAAFGPENIIWASAHAHRAAIGVVARACSCVCLCVCQFVYVFACACEWVTVCLRYGKQTNIHTYIYT